MHRSLEVDFNPSVERLRSVFEEPPCTFPASSPHVQPPRLPYGDSWVHEIPQTAHELDRGPARATTPDL